MATISYSIEQVRGMIKAAEIVRSSLILQFFPWANSTYDGMLVRAAAEEAKRASVPISIHLDHAQSEEIIERAAELPFDSIMVDISHYEKEENLRKTRYWVRHCNERHIVTEAEPGRIEGGEDGVMDTAGLAARFTTTEEVDEFVATGVDTLAPSFGNVHGEYGPQGPRLDFERFAKVRGRANGRVRLAVHGTNGFPPELMKQCIAAGCCKINVNRCIKKVTQATIKWMDIVGSAGKA
ncbi:ketose-bisphosphate aldolase [Aspergillus desertorum]